MAEIKISIDEVSNRFEEHLAIENNNRIIFSGQFGTGKTYFLNEFFKNKTDEYNKIIISPANYVVSSNEDIFELIKADIIKDLLITGKVNIESLPELTPIGKISEFIANKQMTLIKFVGDTWSKLDPTLELPTKILNFIYKNYNAYKSEVNDKKVENKTVSEKIADHLFETNDKIGHIYEHNYITQLINYFLEKIKENGNKKNVLIIDDLDRIDPEHIFRILNILSVHNNQFGTENKFKFEHVIIVCDIDNIRKIFEHKYGKGVDFDGYMDKFYSAHVFQWTNIDALNFYLSATFPSNGDDTFKSFLGFILEPFVSRELISIRKLMKHQLKYDENEKILYSQDGFNDKKFFNLAYKPFVGINKKLFFTTTDFQILRFFKIMANVFGQFSLFKLALKKLKQIDETIDYADIENIVPFFVLNCHLVENTGDSLFISKQIASGQIIDINYPKFSFSGMSFTIYLEWTAGSPYMSDVSYFSNAKVLTDESVSRIDGKSGIVIKKSEFFQHIESIIDKAEKNGWLKANGII